MVDAEGMDMEIETVNHPDHYTDGGIEVIDYMKMKYSLREYLGFCKLNAEKYLARAGKKGSELEDLKKAMRYLQFAVEALEDG